MLPLLDVNQAGIFTKKAVIGGDGTGGRTRTDKPLLATDFESVVFTNFTTPAHAGLIAGVVSGNHGQGTSPSQAGSDMIRRHAA